MSRVEKSQSKSKNKKKPIKKTISKTAKKKNIEPTQKESLDPIAGQVHTFRNVVVENAKLKDIASPDFVKNTFGLFDVEMGKVTGKLKKELAQFDGSEEIKIKFPNKKDKIKKSMSFE